LIVFNREIPIIIKVLEALLRRLPPNHPIRPDIEAELNNYQAGYKGEQSIDYYLSFLPEKDYFILHGLRLPYKNYFFQMDTLILSKSFFLILEVKNISGTLLFDDSFKQLIRMKNNGEKEVFKDPLQQVKLQQYQLANWLKDHKFTNIPIEHLVVITNQNTLLQTNNPNSEYIHKVIPSARLLSKINEIRISRKEERLTEKDLKIISRQMMKKHVPSKPEILNTFNISTSDLLNGVLCETCKSSMFRQKGKWICPECYNSSKNAHVNALMDYALLFDSTITNKQFREFLHIPSRYMALRLLKDLNLKAEGPKKNRKYHLHFFDELPKKWD
jgi:hypothetical protein